MEFYVLGPTAHGQLSKPRGKLRQCTWFQTEFSVANLRCKNYTLRRYQDSFACFGQGFNHTSSVLFCICGLYSKWIIAVANWRLS